ncbi:hypothetical protein BO78DRAFT_468897 [Aspergillus sclerotiicarbonarius CBS 121057]|uniref:Transcription factor domain-containing protein n=1 Tax=Aspergillus sclerotiicarbonarius (strain CBS 121057 / IBT 28362) TaxID=1448318 RepID=A0A319EJC7_ASPSB|nr:hypothetical protein BO78DRAFT_468897 [Aspergillus sclerotiicarbonarius CBS 121057]
MAPLISTTQLYHFSYPTSTLPFIGSSSPFAIKGAYDAGFHYSRMRCLSSSLTLLDCLGICAPEPDVRQDRPLSAFSGGYLIDDLFNSALSVCLELMLERVDESLQGHPLPSIFTLGISGRDGANHHGEHLINVVGHCIAVLELWGSQGQKDFKKYMFLVMVIASVKSRMAGCESLDGVSHALWQNLRKYKVVDEGSTNPATGDEESEQRESRPHRSNVLLSSASGHDDLQFPISDVFLDVGGIDWDSDSWDFLTAFTSAEIYDNNGPDI